MFEMTKIELELITDSGMYIFFKKCLRSRISYIFNRYIKAICKYLKFYDPKQKSKHIIYLDANNCYGYTMCKLLPKSGFKWIDSKKFDLNKYTSNISKGCILKVDLEYSKELGKLYNDYTLVLNKIDIRTEVLSDYQLKIADLCNKLLSSFFDKKLCTSL